jgi:hypothetical protein
MEWVRCLPPPTSISMDLCDGVADARLVVWKRTAAGTLVGVFEHNGRWISVPVISLSEGSNK